MRRILAAALVALAPLAHAVEVRYTFDAQLHLSHGQQDLDMGPFVGYFDVTFAGIGGAQAASFDLHSTRGNWQHTGTVTYADGVVVGMNASFIDASNLVDPCMYLGLAGITLDFSSYTGSGPDVWALATVVPDVPAAPVPEPAEWALLLAGIGALAARRRV